MIDVSKGTFIKTPKGNGSYYEELKTHFGIYHRIKLTDGKIVQLSEKELIALNPQFKEGD